MDKYLLDRQTIYQRAKYAINENQKALASGPCLLRLGERERIVVGFVIG